MSSIHGVVKGSSLDDPNATDPDITSGRDIRWTRVDLGDRWAFHRRPYHAKLEGKNVVCVMLLRTTVLSTSHNIMFTTLADESMGLGEDTKIFPTFEILKVGPHPAPYARMPDCGSFNNWQPNFNAANKVALRITWQHESQWYTRYIQAYEEYNGATFEGTFMCTDQGSHQEYAEGVSLYAYLTRSYWLDPPGWYPALGLAEVSVPLIDHHKQTITLVPDTSDATPLVKPLFSPEPARKYMRDVLKLQNVNGPWESTDRSEATIENDPEVRDREWERTQVAIRNKLTSGRDMCDFCLIYHQIGGIARKDHQCERYKDTDRCKECIHWGRPCSWSYVSHIFGDDWFEQIDGHTGSTSTGSKDTKRGAITDRAKELMKGLVRQPYNTEACTAHKIGDPGWFVTQGDDDEFVKLTESTED